MNRRSLKNIIFLAVLVLMLTALFGGMAAYAWEAEEPEAVASQTAAVRKLEIEDYSYRVQDGNLYITECNLWQETLQIPSEIDGMPVYGIAELGYNLSSVKHLIIPDSVVSLGQWALECGWSLETLELGSGLSYIDYDILDSCESLERVTVSENNPYYTSVDGVVYSKIVDALVYYPHAKEGEYLLPATVSDISVLENYPYLDVVFPENSEHFVTVDGVTFTSDMSTLLKCSLNKEGKYVIPDTVTQVASYAFFGCSKLTEVEIPDSVTAIAYYQFANCAALEAVTIPQSVTAIDEYAFDGCKALKKVNITDVAAWCAIEMGWDRANPLYYAKNLYVNGEHITELEIPKGVKSIARYAFVNCNSFVSVQLPESVQDIEYGAFQNCTGLKRVYISDVAAWCAVDFYSDESNPLYYAKDLYLDGLRVTQLTVPEGVERINTYAFINGEGFASVSLPQGLLSIGGRAFMNCAGVAELVVPDSVEEIYGEAFSGCSGLAEVTLSEKLWTIGSEAFCYCTSLKSITLPESVQYVEAAAFAGCTSLETVNFPSRMPYLGGNCFMDCPLKDVKLPEGTEYIEGYSFSGSAIKEITLPQSVTDIGYAAFAQCQDLTQVDLPDTLQFIDARAFDDTGLYRVQPNGTIYADTAAVGYKGDSAGKAVAIKDGTLIIGCCVYQNKEIVSVGIPLSMKYINSGAFSGCDCLTDVYYAGTQEQWEQIEIGWDNAALDNATMHFNAALVIHGDLDGDAGVSDSDAMYLLRYTLFPDRYPVSQDADVNGDGVVSDADAMYLLRYTLFPDRFPLYPEV